MISVAHLLLSSIQRLLDPFGEEFSSSLEVWADLIFCHRQFSLGFSAASASRLLLLDKLPHWQLQFKAMEVEQQYKSQDTHTHKETGGVEQQRMSSSTGVRSCSNLLKDWLRSFCVILSVSQSSWIVLQNCWYPLKVEVIRRHSPGNYVCRLRSSDFA